MSPEQVVGASLDGRSDLFAVGIVLAEAFMGRRLFTAQNDLDVLLMVRDGRIDRLDKYGHDIPAELQAIVRKALRRDPRVAISMVDMADPYTLAQLRGRVVERRPDTGFKYTDPISKKYIGQAWPMREVAAVALIIEIDKAHYEKLPFEHRNLEVAKKPA